MLAQPVQIAYALPVQYWIDYYAWIKLALKQWYGIEEAWAHVHGGLIIFFAVALVVRGRFRLWAGLGVVYTIAVVNELLDVQATNYSSGALESALDIGNTVVWPTVLFVLARQCPSWRGRLSEQPQGYPDEQDRGDAGADDKAVAHGFLSPRIHHPQTIPTMMLASRDSENPATIQSSSASLICRERPPPRPARTARPPQPPRRAKALPPSTSY